MAAPQPFLLGQTVRIGRARMGFSLVELLVVVSIIMLLGSLSLSGVRLAQRQSKVSVCGSQLRQLWAGVQQYAADWDGFMPMVQECSAYPNNVMWNVRVLEVLSDAPQIRFCPARPNTLTWQIGYGMNSYMNGLTWPCPHPWGPPPGGVCYGGYRLVSSVPKPSENIFVADASNFYLGHPWGASFDYLRHGTNTAQAVYVDGHVGGLSATTFLANPFSVFKP
jgi:prepilin-type processing-associated H-X9-DG protein